MLRPKFLPTDRNSARTVVMRDQLIDRGPGLVSLIVLIVGRRLHTSPGNYPRDRHSRQYPGCDRLGNPTFGHVEQRVVSTEHVPENNRNIDALRHEMINSSHWIILKCGNFKRSGAKG